MLRLLGSVCVMAGAVSFGGQRVWRRRQEQARLRQFFTALYRVERELRCRSPDLADLLQAAAEETSGMVQRFFRACQSGLDQAEGEAFATIWREGFQQAAFSLPPPVEGLLLSLGGVLGRYDRMTQCQVLRYTAQTLEQRWKTEEATLQKRDQLSMTLSVAGGALVLALAC